MKDMFEDIEAGFNKLGKGIQEGFEEIFGVEEEVVEEGAQDEPLL